MAADDWYIPSSPAPFAQARLAGAKLLENALTMSNSELGEDGFLSRLILIKLSSYYVLAERKSKVKQTTDRLVQSLSKPYLSVAKATSDKMTSLERLLREKGYAFEAKKIKDRLTILEHQNCASN